MKKWIIALTLMASAGLYGMAEAPEVNEYGGYDPLYFATSAQEVRDFIAVGSDVNAQTYDYGYTPLMEAALSGNVAVVKELLKHKADVNIQSMPLYDLETMKRDPNIRATALGNAAWAGNEEIVKLLLEAGAIVDKRAIESARTGRNPEAVMPLLMKALKNQQN